MASLAISDIAEWYRDKTIFITGGTGFMGKVLVEKLLRSCPVKRIYLLMRPKKGVDVRQRVEDMFNFKLFDHLKATAPEALQKIVPVRGDITMEGLGLSDDDETRLAEEVSIVFHAAATINFQEPMRVAVNMNMLGTKRVISLMHKMRNLQSMIHVSTAYGNCHIPEIYEELYPPPIDPGRLIQLTEWLSDPILDSLTPSLVEPRPNTYTYTKALAEHLLVNDGGDLPICVVRPTIVCGAWKEPMPGWVDNLFAFTGLLFGMSKGFLRSLYMAENIKLDFVPVDIPINVMIVSAWNTAVKRYKHQSKLPIYCCSSSSEKPLSLEKLAEILKVMVRKYPLDSPIWYPDGSAKTNKFLHLIHIYICNVIPAYVADLVMKLLGKKQIATKLCNRMLKAINALEYFMTRDWIFHNTNVRGLWSSLSPVDQNMFHFDLSQLNWEEYIALYQLGCRKYIAKEKDCNLPAARRTMRTLFWIHRLFQLLLAYGAWCIISSDTSIYIGSTFLDLATKVFTFAPMIAAAEEVPQPFAPMISAAGEVPPS